MNTTAKSLGMTRTRISDSFDGIGNGSNYSTPRDLTKLASSAMKSTTFRTVVKTKSYTAKTVTKTGSIRTMAAWTNTNTLLSSYSGTIGVKTGSGPGQVLPRLRRHPQRQDDHRHGPRVDLDHPARHGRHQAPELRLGPVVPDEWFPDAAAEGGPSPNATGPLAVLPRAHCAPALTPR